MVEIKTKKDNLKKQFGKALKRLEEVLGQKKNAICRDSAIKRFEFSFDLAWKTLKEVLRDYKGINCASPKDCFRQAYQNEIIEYNDFWLEITDWRNEAVHKYDEKFANKLYKNLPKVLKFLQALNDNMQKL